MMLHRLLILFALLCPISAFAADNATLITPCGSGCVTMRSKDVGLGVQSMIQILGDTSGNAIYGTAGSSNSNVLSVQGIASGTALPVSAASLPLPTGAATSANQSTNGATTAHTCSTGGFSELGCLGQIDDDIKATGIVTGSGSAGSAASGVVTVQGIASMTPVLVTLSANADPCSSGAKTDFAIAGTGGNIQIVGGVSAKKVYLCSLSLVAAATATVNIIEGTGAACTTANEAAVIGSTTAANGLSLAANGGLTLGNGAGTVGVTATAANGLCLLQSGTTALAGNATYVQQ